MEVFLNYNASLHILFLVENDIYKHCLTLDKALFVILTKAHSKK